MMPVMTLCFHPGDDPVDDLFGALIGSVATGDGPAHVTPETLQVCTLGNHRLSGGLELPERHAAEGFAGSDRLPFLHHEVPPLAGVAILVGIAFPPRLPWWLTGRWLRDLWRLGHRRVG